MARRSSLASDAGPIGPMLPLLGDTARLFPGCRRGELEVACGHLLLKGDVRSTGHMSCGVISELQVCSQPLPGQGLEVTGRLSQFAYVFPRAC